jgi:hypothetical protein
VLVAHRAHQPLLPAFESYETHVNEA